MGRWPTNSNKNWRESPEHPTRVVAGRRTIKLSACVSDLLALSSWRMLQALAEGETDAAQLAAMADPKIESYPEQLRDALHAADT